MRAESEGGASGLGGGAHLEDVLHAVAVVDVPIEDQHTRDTEACARHGRRNAHVVEQAEALHTSGDAARTPRVIRARRGMRHGRSGNVPTRWRPIGRAASRAHHRLVVLAVVARRADDGKRVG